MQIKPTWGQLYTMSTEQERIEIITDMLIIVERRRSCRLWVWIRAAESIGSVCGSARRLCRLCVRIRAAELLALCVDRGGAVGSVCGSARRSLSALCVPTVRRRLSRWFLPVRRRWRLARRSLSALCVRIRAAALSALGVLLGT